MRAAQGDGADAVDPATFKGVTDRLRAHFFTKAGTPRKRAPNEYPVEVYASPAARKAHWGSSPARRPASPTRFAHSGAT